ncbi:MAG: sigma 54-interacting transcriptional regulator [Deltaproteobacteria bacterium]|nr:sigma 54-interacting transcriptional regulator [Deltaproteobacteria bacterium]
MTTRVPSGDDILTERDLTAYEGPPQLQAVIVVDGVVTMQPLPPRGRLVIGRSSSAELHVDSPRLSRQHAVLHVGETLRIEDLGSANGTRVGDRHLRRGEIIDLAPGEVVELGPVMFVVQRTGGDAPRWTPPTIPSATSRGEPVLPATGPMAHLMRLVERVAAGTINVLVIGETGTGKELVGERIHTLSPRRAGPLVRLNCAAFPETLLESELFGHERGAFTGADRAKQGLLESAHGGTVFLDEIGDMPLSLQAKLLRVLEAREVLPVGAVRPRPIDVRFIAATHQDLVAASQRGSFRADLYYRLNGVTLVLPPLRERAHEIEALARTFIERATHAAQRAPLALSARALALLLAHRWPGNVRELRNVIERAVLMCDGRSIEPEHVTIESVTAPPAAAAASAVPGDLRRDVKELEREAVIAALEQTRGNQTEAARLLGMSRRALVARLDEFKLPRPRKRSD